MNDVHRRCAWPGCKAIMPPKRVLCGPHFYRYDEPTRKRFSRIGNGKEVITADALAALVATVAAPPQGENDGASS